MIIKLMFSNINLIIMIIMTISKMILGFIWYGPLFGKIFISEIKAENKPITSSSKDMKKIIGIALLGALLQSFLINSIFNLFSNLITLVNSSFLGSLNLHYGITTFSFLAVVIWFAFSFPRVLNSILFSKSSIKFALLDSAYELLSIIIMVIILNLFSMYQISQFEAMTNMDFNNLPTY